MTDHGGTQGAGSEHDWTVDVADRIESVVSTVRDRTTVPATRAARAAVFGSLAGFLASVAFILVVIAVVRICVVYLPFHPVARRVWTVYVVAGAIFLLAGALVWRKRRTKAR